MLNVLFILKYRAKETPSGHYTYLNSGVWQSAKFLSDDLCDKDINSKVVQAIDNNCIDRLVTENKPDIVIIEAFWVVPEKFEILQQLHPNIKWIVRNHSAMPFISSEGIIIDWSLKYIEYDNVYVACNEKRTYDQFKFLAYQIQKTEKKVLYLPNTYPIKYIKSINKNTVFKTKGEINIGCFGSIRPLKNHLVQAHAAIAFAKAHNRKLKFHINSAHVEDGGNSALLNLISLFKHSKDCELICHGWLEHNEFLDLCETMDIGMQVSFTETFNIVAADLVSRGVPVVGSNEIIWLYDGFKAAPTSSEDIFSKLNKIVSLYNSFFRYVDDSQKKLKKYCERSIEQWVKTLKIIK